MHIPRLNVHQSLTAASQPNFGAGKIHLWFDSDGTYFPESDQNILKPEKSDTKSFKNLKAAFEALNKFISKFKKDIELNITTGRNRGEYRHYLDLVKKSGLSWVIPDRLVTKNGGDVFLKTSDNTPSEKAPHAGWPSLSSVDKSKREEISKLTRWDSNYIQSTILEVLEEWDFPIVYSPTGSGDYGAKSYKHIWNLVNERFNNPWTAFVRQDGALNFYIGLPPNNAAINVQDSIAGSIKSKLDAKGISYQMDITHSDWENSDGPSITITPKINDKKLDKVYDVTKAIKDAQKDNDLVIVAGNGSNDRTMINPETYSELTNSDGLPLMSIVVGDNEKLLDVAKRYPQQVLSVGQYDLLDGVKKAIKLYAEKHPEFKSKLDPDIAKEIYN